MRKKLLNTIIVIILMVILFNFALSAYSQDVEFEIRATRNRLAVGQSMQLSLIYKNAKNVSTLQLPEIEGFRSVYLGPSTRMTLINNSFSSTVSHNYRLIALSNGRFTIGPFRVKYKNKEYKSNVLTVAIGENISNGTAGLSKQSKEKRLEDRIFAIMSLNKTKFYLNELVSLTIKIYADGLTVSEVQYPEIIYEGFSLGEYEKHKQYQETMNGVLYEVIEFKTDIFGVRPGNFSFGPAGIKGNIVIKKSRRRPSSGFDDFFGDDVFEGFFGRYQKFPFSFKSNAIPVTVIALPQKDKPDNFMGAVGNFDFNISADPKDIEVGDPITLKMTISGEGNFNTLTVPKQDSLGDFKVYEPEVKVENKIKIFEQILMPKTDKLKEIPRIEFCFFNPLKGEYVNITKGPIPIKVSSSEKEQNIKIVEYGNQTEVSLKNETIGKGIAYIKTSPGEIKKIGVYLYKSKVTIFLLILSLGFLFLFLIFHAKLNRLRTDLKYARHLQAPRKARVGIKKIRRYLQEGNVKEFYNYIFKTLQEYLGNKFHLSSASITLDVIEEYFKSAEIKLDIDIINKIKEIFQDCDKSRYSVVDIDKNIMNDAFKNLEEIIDYFQRKKYKNV